MVREFNNPLLQQHPGTEALIRASALAVAALVVAVCLAVAPSAAAQPAVAAPAATQVLRVGPARAIKTLAEASRIVRAGSLVEVDAGEYRADVAVWLRDDVTVRAVGGRVRLLADGADAEGKGIWVVRARRMRVEGFDFEGAKVPSRNGAGIRFESGSLWVRDCRFLHNEMGLLTNNDPSAELTVENSEFAHNQRPDGHNHNLYVGLIGRFRVTGSYFHHARSGHLLKSRAAVSEVLYNRLTDEDGGTASYELEFPNGGVALVVGNIVEQGARTENPYVVSYGAEGYKWPNNELALSYNTLVDLLPQGGSFLRVAPGAAVSVHATNNLLMGRGPFSAGGSHAVLQNNLPAQASDFMDAAAHDFRLRKDSPLRGRAADAAPPAGDLPNRPEREYLHPRGTRALAGPAHNPGALQTAGASASTP